MAWSEFQKRAPTADELRRWDLSDYNVGVACGTPSAVTVLDVDSAEAQAFVDGLNLPLTPYVRTARGFHYYFSAPAEGIGNAAGVGGHKLDFRGDGGYVVGAGSIHESGAPYEWIVSPAEVPFAPFPTKLLDLRTKRKNRPSADQPSSPVISATSGRFESYLRHHLTDAKVIILKADEGKRNDTLFRVGVALARDVAGAEADWAPYGAALGNAALEIGLEGEEVARTLESCWSAGSAEPTPWMITAREWIYLSYPDVFYHVASGQHLKVSAFNNTFANQRVVRGPFSAFLFNGEHVRKVYDLDYQPENPARYFDKDGLVRMNTYRPSEVVATAGDWAPFEDFLIYLVPNPVERAHLLKMLAWTVRNPGKKLRHALLMRSEHQGIGKTMLTEIWAQLLGPRNVRKTTTEEVSGNFQGFIKENLLIILEELNWGVGPIGYNRLKDLITGDIAVVNEKFMPVRHWPNFATFVILTNLRTPIIIEDKDRRIFFIDTPAAPRERNYYVEFSAWWQANLGVIRAYLDTVDLAAFNIYAPPPMTGAKESLIAEGRSDLVKDLALAVDERRGVFDRDIVTLDQIEVELSSSMRGKSKAQLVTALKSFGAVPFQQQRVPGAWANSFFNPTSTRASLWAIRNGEYWTTAGPQARGEEFARRQGLLEIFESLPLAIGHVSEWPGDPRELLVTRIEKPLTTIEVLDLLAGHSSNRLPV